MAACSSSAFNTAFHIDISRRSRGDDFWHGALAQWIRRHSRNPLPRVRLPRLHDSHGSHGSLGSLGSLGSFGLTWCGRVTILPATSVLFASQCSNTRTDGPLLGHSDGRAVMVRRGVRAQGYPSRAWLECASMCSAHPSLVLAVEYLNGLTCSRREVEYLNGLT